MDIVSSLKNKIDLIVALIVVPTILIVMYLPEVYRISEKIKFKLKRIRDVLVRFLTSGGGY